MDEPKDPPTPPQAAADKPPSNAPGEPLKAEVSRTDSPSAGVSAAPPATKPPPAAPAAKAAHDNKPAPPQGPPDPPPPAGKTLPSFITRLQGVVPEAVEQVSFFVGDWTVI